MDFPEFSAIFGKPFNLRSLVISLGRVGRVLQRPANFLRSAPYGEPRAAGARRRVGRAVFLAARTIASRALGSRLG